MWSEICAKCSFRKKILPSYLFFDASFVYKSKKIRQICELQIFYGVNVAEMSVGFGLNNKRSMTGHAPKHQKFVKWKVMTSLPCSFSVKFVRWGKEAAWGSSASSNSFGKKAVKTKHALPHCDCTPCSHASDVSQLFAHAKSLSDSWWFNKDSLSTFVTHKFYKCKQLYWIGASGKILCAPWQQRDWEERKSQFESRRGIERFVTKLN